MYIETFRQNGKYGFKDGWRIVLPAVYEAAASFSDGFAVVVLNNKFGIINESGEFVVENRYDDIRHLFDKYYSARINNGKDWTCGVIDRDGNIIIDFSYKHICSSDDRYFQCYDMADCKNEGIKSLILHSRYSYSNQKECKWFSVDGEFITSLEVRNVHENYLIVADEKNKYGMIRDDARIVLAPVYDRLQYCTDGICIATHSDNGIMFNSIILPDGNIVFTSEKEIRFINGFFKTEDDGIELWYSSEGNLIHKGHASPLSKSYIAVCKNHKYGVIDYQGNKLINFLYDEVRFAESYFVVRRGDKIGLLGLKGEVIVDAIYDKIESVIIENNPVCLGTEVIPAEAWSRCCYSRYCKEYCYDTEGHSYSSGAQFDRIKRQFVSVNHNSRYNIGYSISDTQIDLTKPLILSSDGQKELFTLSEGIIASSKSDNIDPITPLCYVIKSGDKYGVFRIDTQSLIIPVHYDRIQFYGGHTVLLCKDQLWGARSLLLEDNIFQLFFNVDIPAHNIELKILDDTQTIFGAKRTYKNYKGEETGYFTLLDQKGNEVQGVQELFLEDQFTFFDKHHILSKRNGRYGFISSLGYVTLPFIYDEITARKTGGYDVRIGEAWGVIDKDCKETVRVKYLQKLPVYAAAPENSYFGYDEIKDDIAKVTARYKDLFIVTDATSGCKGCLNLKGQEVIPAVFEHLMFCTPGKYDDDMEFDKDVLFFGYGGCSDHSGYGQNFFSDIDGALWGCINTEGQIIIEPKYDCFKVLANFLLAGRDGSFLGEEGNDRDYYNKYSGVYDLYNRDGELIAGGFREICYDEQSEVFALFFGGEWERYSTYSDDWNGIYCYDYRFKYKNDLWLIVDKDLRNIIRRPDGSQYQFPKGFLGKIEIKKENDKVTHVYNMPVALMAKGFSHFGKGCAFIKENNSSGSKQSALSLSSGVRTPFYESICQIDTDKFFFSVERKVGIRTFSEILLPPEYLLFTYPENGFFFAVKETDDSNSKVELFHLKDLSEPICVAVNNTDTQRMIDDIGFSRLKISFAGGTDLSDIQMPVHGIFDEEFLKLIHHEASGYMPVKGSWPSEWKDHYFFATDYRIGNDDSEPGYDDDDRDYMRDTWDAMTDGMYGDMPDGFDGDFDFSGR